MRTRKRKVTHRVDFLESSVRAVDIYKDASILNLNSTFKTLCQSRGAVEICTPNYFVKAFERSVSVLKKISLSTLACYF